MSRTLISVHAAAHGSTQSTVLFARLRDNVRKLRGTAIFWLGTSIPESGPEPDC